ncbi:MAG: hypothetical protein MUF72_02895 [Elainella sp. Prado103]|jgi:hypothetical protein|nr:hypothetical protein [Elainella sp. Prado103]
MQTHFLSLELDLCHPASALQRRILDALQPMGDPLRWAIVAVEPERGKVTVEAVVTRETEPWISVVTTWV